MKTIPTLVQKWRKAADDFSDLARCSSEPVRKADLNARAEVLREAAKELQMNVLREKNEESRKRSAELRKQFVAQVDTDPFF
jgi:hypothetical protein